MLISISPIIHLIASKIKDIKPVEKPHTKHSTFSHTSLSKTINHQPLDAAVQVEKEKAQQIILRFSSRSLLNDFHSLTMRPCFFTRAYIFLGRKKEQADSRVDGLISKRMGVLTKMNERWCC